MITTTKDMRSALRAGEFAWPGGYRILFLTDDGGVLTHSSVRRNYRSILESVKHCQSDGWRVVDTFINWEDDSVYDGDSGDWIAPEYGSHDASE